MNNEKENEGKNDGNQMKKDNAKEILKEGTNKRKKIQKEDKEERGPEERNRK